MDINPHSVLEIGCGFGKYGVLCREFLELWDGRYEYKFKRRIDCVEIFPDYITELHHYVYNDIVEGNAMDWFDYMKKYDLVLIIGTLEHFEKEEGRRLLSHLIINNKKVLISTPLVFQEQGEGFGNKYEEHKSHWTKSEFENLATIEFYKETEQSLICVIS